MENLSRQTWLRSRRELRKDYEFDDNWNECITQFHTRLNDRYLGPIETLLEEQKLRGEGFAILTLQCALIEMLAAFRKGMVFTPQSKKRANYYEYNSSKTIFVDFLNTQDVFAEIFHSKKGNAKIFNATSFYKEVRCGLMHEAKTKGDWTINAKKLERYSREETKFITQRDNGNLSIDRTILNFVLRKYINQYQDDLRAESGEGKTLRRNFARKLDHYYDIPRDTSYEWWEMKI